MKDLLWGLFYVGALFFFMFVSPLILLCFFFIWCNGLAAHVTIRCRSFFNPPEL